MTKGRKLDAATEQQAIAFVRRYIEIRGGLSRDWQLWRATRKQELCGQPELPDEWVRKYKEWISDLEQVKAHFGRKDIDRVATRIQRRYEAQISKRPLTWDPKVAAKLFAAAKQGNPDADQVLREVAAAYLERGELPPKPLLDYTAKYLRAPSGGKRATQRSLETESRNRRLARLVHAVSQKFGLNATRGRDPKNTKDDYRPDCACSIVAKAIRTPAIPISESKVRQAWEQNQDFDRNARDLVAELIEWEQAAHSNPSNSKQSDKTLTSS